MGQLPPFCFCSLSDSKRRKLVSKFEVLWFFFQVLRCCKRKNSTPSFKLVDILSSSQVVQRRNLAPNFKLSEWFENKKLTNLGYEPRILIKKRARSPIFFFCRVFDLVFAEPNGSRQKHKKLLVLKALLNAMFCDVLCWVKILGDLYGPETPCLR